MTDNERKLRDSIRTNTSPSSMAEAIERQLDIVLDEAVGYKMHVPNGDEAVVLRMPKKMFRRLSAVDVDFRNALPTEVVRVTVYGTLSVRYEATKEADISVPMGMDNDQVRIWLKQSGDIDDMLSGMTDDFTYALPRLDGELDVVDEELDDIVIERA